MKNYSAGLPPPQNRLDDDLAKLHAEKYKTETTWYQKPIESDPDADQDSLITTLDDPAHDKDFIFEDGMTKNEESVIFIDVQGQGTYVVINM